MNVIIFSKDRACQLDLLLRSIKELWTDYKQAKISIIYTHSNQEFEQGYDLVKELHLDFEWVREIGNFKQHVVSQIKTDLEWTMFLVDDIVFKNSWMMADGKLREVALDERIICLSLRMHPQINRCYTSRQSTPPPAMIDKCLWDWQLPYLKGDWAYPLSVDGHVFRTVDVLPLILRIGFSNPSDLEGQMYARHGLNHRNLIMCYQDSKIVNIPCNKVNTVNDNFHGNITADFLNQELLNGKRAILPFFFGVENTAPHEEYKIFMTESNDNNIINKPHNYDIFKHIEDNSINYDKVLNSVTSSPRGDKNIDISVIIPFRGRHEFITPCANYLSVAAAMCPSLNVTLTFVENDKEPTAREEVVNAGASYIFIPSSITQSDGKFAKSLCYNVGWLIAKSNWNLLHDLDILVPGDFFCKLSSHINNCKSWLQPYAGRRVIKLDESATDQITSNPNKMLLLSELTGKEANSGSTGGSILVSSKDFSLVGGYDPELFYGYGPEDSFFWSKLEMLYNENLPVPISDPFQGNAFYADDPAIDVYHLNHKKHKDEGMLKYFIRIQKDFWDLDNLHRHEFIGIKRKILEEASCLNAT